jgi:hypothetical protein
MGFLECLSTVKIIMAGTQWVRYDTCWQGAKCEVIDLRVDADLLPRKPKVLEVLCLMDQRTVAACTDERSAGSSGATGGEQHAPPPSGGRLVAPGVTGGELRIPPPSGGCHAIASSSTMPVASVSETPTSTPSSTQAAKRVRYGAKEMWYWQGVISFISVTNC